MNLIFRGTTSAYHCRLEFLPESLVGQSIHNWINGRIEEHHWAGDGNGCKKIVGGKMA